jgi:uncharacterized membrane protein
MKPHTPIEATPTLPGERQLLHVPPTVARVERLISTLLRVGVVLSLAVVVLGTVISFGHHPGYLWSGQELAALTGAGKAGPNSVAEIVAGVAAGRGAAVVMAGLLILIATPVLRVGVAIIAFLLQRDWVFTVVTAVVFALLVLSFFLGRAGM